MKIVYISTTHSGMHHSSIYYDLMQEFVSHGHEVTIVYAREKRLNKNTKLYRKNNIQYLGIKTGNITKNKNLIEKGIATLTIDGIFVKGIKKHLGNEKFDLVLYSTPPITFIKTIRQLRKQSPKAFIYLMLKDIFPQNAVDIGMMSDKGFLYKMFKNKERTLYSLVDYIGTMSPANKEYILKQEPGLINKVEILPNSVKVIEPPLNNITRADFGIPEDKTVLLYGGNLGKPQGIPFVLECIKSIKDREDLFFVIAGSGGDQDIIENYYRNENPKNFLYLGQLENQKYHSLTQLCDIGLIYLDYRFIIPNYPQRLLSYLSAKKPIICATDPNTDIGKIAVENGYGYSVMSNDVNSWYLAVDELANDSNKIIEMGENGFKFLKNNYTVEKAYEIIMNHFKV